MAENDLNMIDLVLIHLTHPWPLDGLVHGTHFLWSYLVISDMPENGQKVPAQLGLWVYKSENHDEEDIRRDFGVWSKELLPAGLHD